jgi:hypothetical protein
MKLRLRITKGRIACAVVLLPVLYVLNAGPMVYCVTHFGVGQPLVEFLYLPLVKLTATDSLFCRYLNWWEALPP